MHRQLMRSVVSACVVLCTLLPLTANAMEVLGKKPGHVWGGPSSVANDQAITMMIWAPGVDDGHVPQGITWADGSEAGSLRWQKWSKTFPLLFRVDLSKLKENR